MSSSTKEGGIIYKITERSKYGTALIKLNVNGK
jgi:hypothetical protein